MKVVLDSNFILDLIRFNLFDQLKDVEERVGKIELVTIKPVIDELKKLKKGKGKNSLLAKLAFKWLEKEKIKIVEKEGKVDDLLLKLGKEFVIATNDRALRKKLKEKGAKIMYIRARKKIVVE